MGCMRPRIIRTRQVTPWCWPLSNRGRCSNATFGSTRVPVLHPFIFDDKLILPNIPGTILKVAAWLLLPLAQIKLQRGANCRPQLKPFVHCPLSHFFSALLLLLLFWTCVFLFFCLPSRPFRGKACRIGLYWRVSYLLRYHGMATNNIAFVCLHSLYCQCCRQTDLRHSQREIQAETCMRCCYWLLLRPPTILASTQVCLRRAWHFVYRQIVFVVMAVCDNG